MNLHDLTDCVFARWSPQIGDPTVIGWITVASYFIVSVFSAMVVYNQFGRHRMFWLILTVFLLALGINKLLDLQSALTAVGRCLAQAQGWYDERRAVQLRFIISIIVMSFLFGCLLIWMMRRYLTRIWLALTGVLLLIGFVAIRAVGFHHFDQFIGHEIGGVRVNWTFEIGGTAMIGLNALYLLFRGSNDDKLDAGCNR